jgi:copper(I)-binding protein
VRYAVLALGFLALVAGWLGVASGVSSSDIQIMDAWVHESTGPRAVLHLKITSGGMKSDRLVRISTELAKRIEIFNQQGQASTDLVIPADSQWVIGPDAPRLELVQLRRPLKAPASFPIVFVFERAGNLYAQVRVEAEH